MRTTNWIKIQEEFHKDLVKEFEILLFTASEGSLLDRIWKGEDIFEEARVNRKRIGEQKTLNETNGYKRRMIVESTNVEPSTEALPFAKLAVGSSGFYLTELRFRELMSEIPNGSESYRNGKKIVHFEFWRQVDNKFSLSYHLKFPQKNVQFNFWFDKISYINSNESVVISFHNGNEKFEKDRLKNIFKTNNLNELKAKINELFNEYK